MAEFVEKLHNLYKSKKAEQNVNRDEIQKRRLNDITLFFEQLVKADAMDKMLARAQDGCPTANLLEYQYNERFYIDEENKVVRFINEKVNFPNYRIHDIVTHDNVFKTLIKDYQKELLSDDNKITIECWRPKDKLCVIEAVWGKNRYHNKHRMNRSNVFKANTFPNYGQFRNVEQTSKKFISNDNSKTEDTTIVI